MAVQSRAKTVALLLKARKIVFQEAKGLKPRRVSWESLVHEAVDKDDFEAENLAADGLRQEEKFADQVKKLVILVKLLSGFVDSDKRGGVERRAQERRKRKVPVAKERRLPKERRQGQRRMADQLADCLKRVKANLKIADKAYTGFETAKGRFFNGVETTEWDASVIRAVADDEPNWEEADKVFRELFKAVGIGT
jgi:hypothetical protein